MMSDTLALFLGPDASSPGNGLLGQWRTHTGNGRLQRINGSTPAGRAGNVMRMTTAVSTVCNLQPSTGQNAGRTWAVTPGSTLTFCVSIRASAARPTSAIAWNMTDAAGAAVTTPTTTVPITTAWQDFRAVVTVPANAVAMAPAVNNANMVAGTDWIEFCQAGIFPGDVPAWVPSAGAYTVNRMDAERASMESDLINGASGVGAIVSGWRNPFAASPAVVRDNTRARSGPWSLRGSTGTAAVARIEPMTAANARNVWPTTPLVPLTLMASVWCSNPIPPNTTIAQMVWFATDITGGSAATLNFITDEGIPAGQWYDLVLPARTNVATVLWAWPNVQPGGLVVNTDVWFDRVGLFDGHVGTWTHPLEVPPAA